MSFPTARQVAVAYVVAARLAGEDPLDIVNPAAGDHARWVALAALKELFPKISLRRLAPCIGAEGASRQHPGVYLRQRRSAGWWSDEWVDEAVGAVLADDGAARPDGSAAQAGTPPGRAMHGGLGKKDPVRRPAISVPVHDDRAEPNAKYRLRHPKSGAYLNFDGSGTIEDADYAWIGSRAQGATIRERTDAAAGMVLVKVPAWKPRDMRAAAELGT